MNTIEQKTIQLIKDHPGKNGPELKKLYSPSIQVLRKLEEQGWIIFQDGWYHV